LAASAIALSSTVFAAESTSPLDSASHSRTLTRDAVETANADDKDEDEDEQVTPYIEELFLGKIVYPQEAGEVQLTGGYFHGDEVSENSSFLFEVEYGITDQLQIGAEAATHFEPDESFQDLQQCSVGVYYNFYNDRQTGGAYGLGFEFGLPVDATGDEPRACVYEPFFVAYQDYRSFAVNLSAALEIADPVARGEETDVAGDVTLAVFRRVGRIATILETNVGFDSEESPVRLAPGLYWRPFDVPLDLAVSLPVGLNHDAPNLGVFVLMIFEFPASALKRR
jgi:opacity protein-like surface antigen